MAQKIQFISSVLHDPEVIILDEPLSGFDPLNINLILNEIEAFKNAGKSVIFSTHNMDSVDSICDEVALIHAGKLIAKDRVANLRSQHKNGDFKIRFRGNVIAFANALWTSFEIVESKEIGDDLREAVIRRRGNETFNDVYNQLSSALELTLIEEKLPGMQDVFVKVIQEHNQHEE
jgi:ABC-2 type transport system ATP-binding protein